jgi:enamine deaminase RidA (YjgF/YER057c/UK114 family)
MTIMKSAAVPPRRAIIAEGAGFLFVGAITPHDADSGSLVTSIDGYVEDVKPARAGLMFFDFPEAPVLAQTWVVYQHLARILKERGLSLAHLVRQRVFIRDLRERPAIERVMDLVLGDARPATSIVIMAPEGIHPDLHVQIDAIAALNRADCKAFNDELMPRYPVAVRSGNLVFTSHISGVAGEDATDAMDAADMRLLATGREKAIYAQGLRTFANLKRVLGLAGAEFSDILKVNGWTGFPMREYGAAVLARRRFFDQTRQNMMASTGLAVGGPAEQDALLSFDAVALVSAGGDQRKEVLGGVSSVASPYVAGAVKGGGLIFTSGEIPVRQPAGEVIATCAQLTDAGKQLRFGHVEPESGMESRAWFVFRTLENYLASLGSSFGEVVHQTVFIKHPQLFPELERIATLFYGPTLPPTTIVPIAGTTPLPTAELEIEVIAAAS